MLARILLILQVAVSLLSCASASGQSVAPLPRAHAHNDYIHPRPLRDALDNGFGSVEADIFLADGALLVAHNRADVRADRSLESLYLEPLRKRIAQNANHRVYAGSDLSLILLVDIKEDGEKVYAALRPLLEKYREILTRWDNGAIQPGAVTVLLSGDRPIQTVASQTQRLCALDGRLSDLDDPKATSSLYPLISQNWSAVSKWFGVGAFPESERKTISELVKKAHGRGMKVRFWATGNGEAVWRAVYECGVDFLNADDLPKLRGLLTEWQKIAEPKR